MEIALVVSLVFDAMLVVAVAALWHSDRSRAREIERVHHSYASERRQLLDRIMYATGKTWMPPPADLYEDTEEDADPFEPYDPMSHVIPL